MAYGAQALFKYPNYSFVHGLHFISTIISSYILTGAAFYLPILKWLGKLRVGYGLKSILQCNGQFSPSKYE